MTHHHKQTFGNFSLVADTYTRRPPFSGLLLEWLVDHVRRSSPEPIFADVGAGTGAIAYALAELGLRGYAIDPDAEMVAVGSRSSSKYPEVTWINAPGESTTLPDFSLDWVCYSSSFHWTQTQEAVRESLRILKPRGHFSITYHLLDLTTDPFHIEIENRIRRMAPALKRARPPIMAQMDTYEAMLGQHPSFGSCLAMGITEAIPMSKEQYVNYWAGSHDIPSQTDPGLWHEILEMIGGLFAHRSPGELRFRSTAWHVQRR
ncbi:class I SAM-dependent methyltransferase [Rhizobium mongolense]|uniref:Ubiquinone/menaquinone biosynthesis C-methylase UbiE n=2 Tax=Rhizobium mongolense TaxID=57676 RepID=A0ABR6IX94_9HYPH|nr:class I SAM-dependent methyltransferase [Rhizobium mongolense]MBB4232517.1 ubiquinone/menaquinone biosynthesis C-methylase UbiE [Rhizobium mongolense]TVZ75041.1 methyltransferase family protein [Rhizobium mongolense USDA 1844]